MTNTDAIRHGSRARPGRGRSRRLAALAALGLYPTLLAPLGCGSEQSKMDRGDVVDREVAVPDSTADDAMTEAEREARETAEDQ